MGIFDRFLGKSVPDVTLSIGQGKSPEELAIVKGQSVILGRSGLA